jgi:hypothetical protein
MLDAAMVARPRQLPLPFQTPATPAPADAARRLRLALEARVGEPIHLTVTRNRHRIVTVQTRADGVHALRVHFMFLDADAHTVRFLARYVERRDHRASRELGRFIAEHRHLLDKERRTRSVLLRTRGRHHDLQSIYDALNATFFSGSATARITWGSRAPRARRKRRSIKLGSYCVDDRIIRVHPTLDSGTVPRFFIEWIVFHEMLHEVFGVQEAGGRRCFHSPEFRDRERTFPMYDAARAWEHEHLEQLLSGAV